MSLNKEILDGIKDNLSKSLKVALLDKSAYSKGIDPKSPLGIAKEELFDKYKKYVKENTPKDELFEFESEWIASATYNEILGKLTIEFNPLTTNNKLPIVLGLVGADIPRTFVNDFVAAPSPGKFYLDYIAQYRWMKGMSSPIPNPTKLFDAITIDDILAFNPTEDELPSEILEKVKDVLNFAKNNLKNNAKIKRYAKTYIRKTILNYAKKNRGINNSIGMYNKVGKDVLNMIPRFSAEARRVQSSETVKSVPQLVIELNTLRTRALKAGAQTAKSFASGRYIKGTIKAAQTIKLTLQAKKAFKDLLKKWNTMNKLKKEGSGNGMASVMYLKYRIKIAIRQGIKEELHKKKLNFKAEIKFK